MTDLQRFLKENPDGNPIYQAMRELKDPTAMRRFYRDYVAWLKKDGEPTPQATATANFNWVLMDMNHSAPNSAKRWGNALGSRLNSFKPIRK